MPHGVHNNVQTAFRFPAVLAARLKDAAKRHGETMTDIAARGITAELDRLDGEQAKKEEGRASHDRLPGRRRD